MSEAIEVRSPNADEVVRLRREIAGLESELEAAKAEAKQYKLAAADSVHVIRAFRKLFDPWHLFIGTLYGEISRLDAEAFESGTGASTTSGDDAKWAAVKSRLGGKRAEIIDILLVQGELTITQIAKAIRSHYNTAQKLLQDMYQQGVLTKNGSAYSLKR